MVITSGVSGIASQRLGPVTIGDLDGYSTASTSTRRQARRCFLHLWDIQNFQQAFYRSHCRNIFVENL